MVFNKRSDTGTFSPTEQAIRNLNKMSQAEKRTTLAELLNNLTGMRHNLLLWSRQFPMLSSTMLDAVKAYDPLILQIELLLIEIGEQE